MKNLEQFANKAGYLQGLEIVPCSYGLPVSGNLGDIHGETKKCGQPSVYKEVGGGGCYCADHAEEVAAHDEDIWGD